MALRAEWLVANRLPNEIFRMSCRRSNLRESVCI